VTDHVGMTSGNDIRVVLETQQKLIIPDPAYPASDPGEIMAAEAKKKAQFQRMKKAWTARIDEIKNDAQLKDTSAGQIEITELENKIKQAEDEANTPPLAKVDLGASNHPFE
jgi:crotonobetainyl-CoA:carnitine CoA-transferase CaiB-like acyl-CoA transferase